MPALVSTIIPVYNRASLLREAVASVLAQTYQDFEIIIVDDGSTDDTLLVADDLSRRYPDRVGVIHQANTGPGLAREAGRRRARGEFIQYLDSDDLLLPRKFELQVAGLNAHPECGVAYGKTQYRHSEGRLEELPWKGSGNRVSSMFPSFLRERWWDTPTPLYRADICEQAGSWSDLQLEEDWEYDCRVAALGVRLHYCNEFVAEVRDHEQNRLCKGTALDPIRLKERAKAHSLIFAHAQRAGVKESESEMQHFARELFLLARQCGAAGLATESKELFVLAKNASGNTRAEKWDFKLYELLADITGWTFLGKMVCLSDSLRK
jgi:glycosyltransferase involved in cell wall biosynthesis